ncbi:hypothetical protein ET495_06185 [Xylanimonas allomyrinae]|uniref:Uncharacterized protein n=1 Tax=Xylanimonas allomyrinae TaxID=2509459 RepID=A0A4V0YE42_9MICO|nr:hypothetical protein [Xylanimonas allomyrinae]QAY62901.1 hypothetical protein ET495_06185 [Xylanimonas allomyrinae]
MTGLADRLPPDVAERLAALTERPHNSVRDRLVQAAADARCALCLDRLDEPAPACAGQHVGPARRKRPAHGARRSR